MTKVSIIIPTKNDEKWIEKCLNSISDLEFKDYEVIIVDGHSEDRTLEIANKFGCRVIFEEKGTISYARDLGVKHAKGDFIAFTDADCIVAKNWLNELLRVFEDDKMQRIAAVGGPNLTPEDDSEFGKCVGDVLFFLSKAGARYGFTSNEIKEVYHNPTCNVMYRKKVLKEVGGFNHELITVDDEELDYRIRKKGYRILFNPNAIVWHYRRQNWKSFAKMAWNYGIGRMQAVKLHPEMFRFFYFIPTIIILIVLIFLSIGIFFKDLLMIAMLILILGGIGISLISLFLSIKRKKLRRFPTYFGLIAIWFWGYGLGVLRGIFK